MESVRSCVTAWTRRYRTWPSHASTGRAFARTTCWSESCARSGGARVWWQLPRRQKGRDVGGGAATSHRRHPLGQTRLLGHGSPARSEANRGRSSDRVTWRIFIPPRGNKARRKLTRKNQFQALPKINCAQLARRYRHARGCRSTNPKALRANHASGGPRLQSTRNHPPRR